MKKSFALLLSMALWTLATPLLYYPLDSYENPIKNQGSVQNVQTDTPLVFAESYIKGVKGNGLFLHGMSDGLVIDRPCDFLKGPVYVSMYFRPDRLEEDMTLACFLLPNKERVLGKTLSLYTSTDKCLYFTDLTDHTKRIQQKVSQPLNVGQWYHAVWAMTGEKWILYLDGKLSGEMATPARPDTSEAVNLHIANSWYIPLGRCNRFVGMMDEIAISSELPSEAEFKEIVSLLAKGGKGRPEMVSTNLPKLSVSAHLDAERQQFKIGAETVPAMFYRGTGFGQGAPYALETLAEARKTGVGIYCAPVAGGRTFCSGNWWIGMGQYDFDVVDRYLDFVFRCEPSQRIMLLLPASPPDWWGREFPDEICQDIHGKISQDYFASHSYASEKWLKDLDEAWGAFFEHIKKQPYYDRIVGYIPISGRYGECLRANFNSQLYKRELTDYSPAELNGYRRWLKKTYGTIETMKAAYKAGTLPDSFDEIQLPGEKQRLRPDSTYLADPVVDRAVIDYYMFTNEASADAVIAFTKMLRKYGGDDKIIGLYQGYVLGNSGSPISFGSDSGHCAFGKMLKEAPVDFYAGPIDYCLRQMGSCAPPMSTPQSITLNGRIWLNEDDERTHIHGGPGRAEYNQASNLAESLAIQWRSFGTSMVDRSGMWLFPIQGGGCFDAPEFWQAFTTMYQEMERAAANPAKDDHTTRIAVVVDPYSYHFRRLRYGDQLYGSILSSSRDAFHKSGVAFDYYLLSDLEEIPDDYPAYFMLGNFYLDRAQLNTINRRFKKDGKLLLWSYGSGYFRSEKPNGRYSVSNKNITETIGINVNAVTKLAHLQTLPTEDGKITTEALELPSKFNPAFFVDDENAQAFAQFTNEPLLEGRFANAYKDLGDWKSVFLGMPVFQPEMVRDIARLAGAHVYTPVENIVVRIGNGYIMLHSDHEATVPLTLPKKAKKIVDVPSGRTIATGTAEFDGHVAKNGTSLYRVEY